MATVAGIDGCRSGWLCITEDLASGETVAQILPNIAALLTLVPRPDVAMVDVPIGLPDSGARECDVEARKLLKRPRASSVFPAPVRPLVGATDYAHACRIGTETDGRKLSRQTFAILPKIKEVDDFIGSDPEVSKWVREIHPELCFWAWNGKKPMANRKKSSAGKTERETLVKRLYGPAYAAAQSSLPRGEYANDDLLDAFAALWTAVRLVSGKAILLPDSPPRDSCGLRMEMVV